MGIARAKLVTAGALLAVACGYMAYAAATSDWVYYQEVDEVARPGSPRHRKVRVHGVVDSQELNLRTSELAGDFILLGQHARLRVEFQGPVPDGLRAGASIVAEGRIDDGGVMQADVLLTKCASKYRSHAESGVPIGPGTEAP